MEGLLFVWWVGLFCKSFAWWICSFGLIFVEASSFVVQGREVCMDWGLRLHLGYGFGFKVDSLD